MDAHSNILQDKYILVSPSPISPIYILIYIGTKSIGHGQTNTYYIAETGDKRNVNKLDYNNRKYEKE